MRVQSLGQEDPMEKEMATPVFLPGKSHGQRSRMGYSSWGRRVRHAFAPTHTPTFTLVFLGRGKYTHAYILSPE